MSKVKVVAPSGKVVYLGDKAMQSTSVRAMGYRLYDEVYPPVPPIVPVATKVEAPLPEWDATEEKPKHGRPRKNTMSDADQA